MDVCVHTSGATEIREGKLMRTDCAQSDSLLRQITVDFHHVERLATGYYSNLFHAFGVLLCKVI